MSAEEWKVPLWAAIERYTAAELVGATELTDRAALVADVERAVEAAMRIAVECALKE